METSYTYDPALVTRLKKKAKEILRHDPTDLSPSEYRNLRQSAKDLASDVRYEMEWADCESREELDNLYRELCEVAHG